jgi:hypothetical protein
MVSAPAVFKRTVGFLLAASSPAAGVVHRLVTTG